MQLGDMDEMAEPFLVRVMKVVLPELLPGIDLVHGPPMALRRGAGRSVSCESENRRAPFPRRNGWLVLGRHHVDAYARGVGWPGDFG
jgi:hypothetical protein